jgi:hypothetical protein
VLRSLRVVRKVPLAPCVGTIASANNRANVRFLVNVFARHLMRPDQASEPLYACLLY